MRQEQPTRWDGLSNRFGSSPEGEARACRGPLSARLAEIQVGGCSLPVLPDCVEEVRSCRRFVWLIQSGPGDRSAFDDGGMPRPAGGAVLSVLARTTCAGEALIAVDRSVRRTRRTATRTSTVLQ